MSIELAILGLLADEESSGYDLRRRLSESHVRQLWYTDQARIYRTLQRLQGEGMVASRRIRQSDRPDRIVYRLTEAGAASLDRTLAEPICPPAVRDSFLLQVDFAHRLDDAELLGVLQSRRDDLTARLEALQTDSALLEEGGAAGPRAMVLQLTALDGVAVQLRALIDWLDACIEAVRSGAVPPR